jgi:hypothetical protein
MLARAFAAGEGSRGCALPLETLGALDELGFVRAKGNSPLRHVELWRGLLAAVSHSGRTARRPTLRNSLFGGIPRRLIV